VTIVTIFILIIFMSRTMKHVELLAFDVNEARALLPEGKYFVLQYNLCSHVSIKSRPSISDLLKCTGEGSFVK
jgi:hypothetical protein